jgi:N6-L-threonylcarbamoyladenine synthase
MNILGIETSCDETSAAVLVDGEVRSNIISSQFIHRHFGGIVPELASRAHQRLIVPVVEEALTIAGVDKSKLSGIAVTAGPGLIGALLVGVNFGKAMAYALRIPFVGVNHLEAHIYSNFIRSNFIKETSPQKSEQISYPFICLLVSGGHTQLVRVTEPLKHELLGETLDDAAGEAFDKVGKMLGLGFPGGPAIDALAKKGNPEFVKFPRSYLENFEFSFSGIKTSVLYWLRDKKLLSPTTYPAALISPSALEPQLLADLCASFQAAVIDVLAAKVLTAVKKFNIKDVAVAGGVSANSALRNRLQQLAAENNLRLSIPKLEYCTDNGAMIAHLGWMKLERGIRSTIELDAEANLAL